MRSGEKNKMYIFNSKCKINKIKHILTLMVVLPIILAHTNMVMQTSLSLVWEKDLGDNVWSIGWFPDGSKLLVTGSFGKVIIFSASGIKIREVSLSSKVDGLSFAPDGKFAVGTLGEGKVYVYSPEANLLWQSTTLGKSIETTDWSHDGTKLVVGTYGNYKVILYKWLDKSAQKIWEVRVSDSIRSVRFSPDGNTIAVGTSDGKIYMISSDSGSILWYKTLSNGNIPDISWSPDGSKLAVLTADNGLYVLSVNGKILYHVDLGGRGPAQGILWYEDYIIVGDHKGNIVFTKWFNNRLSILYTSKIANAEIDNRGIAMHPNGKYLAVGSFDNHIRVYDVSEILKSKENTITITITSTATVTSTKTITETQMFTVTSIITKTITLTKTHITEFGEWKNIIIATLLALAMVFLGAILGWIRR